ncbi:MAG: DUF2853 family protein [Bacteroidota bacterium]
MSKFDEKLAAYEAELAKYDSAADNDLLRAVTKGLGPSIYNKDSHLVACSDKEEVARVVNNYAVKKLGVSQADGETAVAEVCKAYDTRQKHRAVFYYMVCKKLGKEGIYA